MAEFFSYLSTLLYWVLTLYEWIVIIAILLSWVHPDPHNPIVQFLNSLTVPLWNWLRPHLPAAIQLFTAYISLLLIWFLKIFLPGAIGSLGGWLSGQIDEVAMLLQVSGYFLLGTGIVLQNFLFFLILLFLVWFFLTLVSPSTTNPIVRTIYFLVDPFISPLQRRLPRTRVDFSPVIAAGICLAISYFVVTNLLVFSSGLAAYGQMELPAGRIY